MFSRFTTLLLSLFALLLLSSQLSHAEVPLETYCSINTKASAASRKNIAKVLLSIETSGPDYGLAIAEYGTGDKDRATGLSQCRPDVSAADCKACLKEASTRLASRCKGKAEGWVWYEKCFMRHDTKFFTGALDTSYGAYNQTEDFISENLAERKRFDTVLGSLIKKVRIQAASKTRFGLGKGKASFSRNVTVYALAQCTRDLSTKDCSDCITFAFTYFPNLCAHKRSCKAMYRSCYVGYDTKPYFNL